MLTDIVTPTPNWDRLSVMIYFYLTSDADPDLSDPDVFGPPESRSGCISQRYGFGSRSGSGFGSGSGSGSGFFYHQAKIVTLIPTVL
jgi:hypothetical protein